MYASGGDMPSYENGGEYQTEWGELEAVLILKVLELHIWLMVTMMSLMVQNRYIGVKRRRWSYGRWC
jgi:hypothetical protein